MYFYSRVALNGIKLVEWNKKEDLLPPIITILFMSANLLLKCDTPLRPLPSPVRVQGMILLQADKVILSLLSDSASCHNDFVEYLSFHTCREKMWRIT